MSDFKEGVVVPRIVFLPSLLMEVGNVRLSLKVLSKAEREILLLGKLQTFYHPPKQGSPHPSPKRAYLTYAYDSSEICEGAFCFIHGIGDFSLRSLKKHLRNNGITPLIHGNKGKKTCTCTYKNQ